MEPDEFLTFCEDLREVGETGGNGKHKTFLRAVYLGHKHPDITPSIDDDVVLEGYTIGKQLSKRLK